MKLFPVDEPSPEALGRYKYFKNLSAKELQTVSDKSSQLTSNLISDFSLIIVVNSDTDLLVAWVSESFEKFIGFTWNEIREFESFLDLVHPKDQERVKSSVKGILSGNSKISEHRMKGKNNEALWIRCLLHPERSSETEKIVRIYGAGYIITEEKRLNELLVEANTKLHSLINAVPDIIFFKDLNGINWVVNEAFAKMAGKKRGEIIGQDDSHILPVDLAGIWKSTDQRVFQTEKSHMSIDMTEKEGVVHYYETIKSPFYNKKGELEGLVGLSRDITERVNSENELHRNRERYLLTAKSGKSGIWDWNQKSNQIYIDSNLRDLLGLEDEQRYFEISEWELRIFEEDRERIIKSIKDYLRGTSDSLEIEHKMVHSSGKVIWLDTRGNVFRDITNGKVIRLLGTSTDITIRKQALIEKQRLENLLHQSSKLESIGRVAGSVAHDFNNLLTSIVGNAELGMMMSEGNSALHNFFSKIKSTSDHSANLIKQLMTFSRQQVISPERVNINEIIGSIDEIILDLLRDDINYNKILGQDSWDVFVDPTQMESVLINLIKNARDSMTGSGEIEVSTKNVKLDETIVREIADLGPGEYVLISISDKGCGMDQDTINRIFEPFYSTKSEEKGIGLGLATVYGIVKQAKGAICVDSAIGQGTTFRIYFPIHK